MGCAVVRGLEQGEGGARVPGGRGAVRLCTINSPLFGAHRSDRHAEANAVAACAARGEPMRGLSVYVTRSPCVACYKLLAAAGVRRSWRRSHSTRRTAPPRPRRWGSKRARWPTARRARRGASSWRAHEDMGRVRALREERKRLRKESKFGRKTIRAGAGGAGAPAAAPGEAPAAARDEPMGGAGGGGRRGGGRWGGGGESRSTWRRNRCRGARSASLIRERGKPRISPLSTPWRPVVRTACAVSITPAAYSTRGRLARCPRAASWRCSRTRA